MSFDLTNTDLWEFVFVDSDTHPESPSPATDEQHNFEDTSGDVPNEQKLGGVDDDQLLDLPPPWSDKLGIDRDRFNRKYGTTGRVTTLYAKAKQELFAPHMHEQGMVSRLVLYVDALRTVPREIREDFENRADHLVRRVRFPLENRLEEDYEPGAKQGLRRFIELTGKRRELHFYTSARPGSDGLLRREEDIGKKIIEVYEDRDDHLIYRSVTFDNTAKTSSASTMSLPGSQLGEELTIRKMAEKFSDPLHGDGETENVAKRKYYVQDGIIAVHYHYLKGRITSSSRTFNKDVNKQITDPEKRIKVTLPHPNSKRPKESVLEEEFQRVQQHEKDCYTSLRDSIRSGIDLLASRKRDYESNKLVRSIFDAVRDKAKEESKESGAEAEAEAETSRADYLTPFINAKDPQNLSPEEALHAKEACLRTLKERLLERANIIQRRLDDENSLLLKKQAAYQRSRDHVDNADDDFEKFCQDAMFRIQILEQRLLRHEENALMKYTNLDKRLRADPRLSSIY